MFKFPTKARIDALIRRGVRITEANRLLRGGWSEYGWSFDVAFSEYAEWQGYWEREVGASDNRDYLVRMWLNSPEWIRPPSIGPVRQISLIQWLSGPIAEDYPSTEGER